MVRDLDRLALCLRHQDLEIGRDHGGITIDRNVRQAGEMRQSARDRSLVFGSEHVVGDDIPPARA